MIDSELEEAAVFNAARHIDAPQARAAYLQQACRDDQTLHDRVRALLRIYTEESEFLEDPVQMLAGADDIWDAPGAVGTAIGPYKLLEQIGEGGMGLVFMAEQQSPMRRLVALKIIKPGMDTRQVIARFEAERQTLAMMDHLHIARVFDAGVTDGGLPYFVMELFRGVPMTEFCDRGRLGTNQRLDLFATVCEAVQHAHQKGVIHRDLKPSNILVSLHDGKAVPKVIDFGVAKAVNQRLADAAVQTHVTQLIGTPTYMSPEQAETGGRDVDTRSDVYSLGVVLYELLTGSTPFDKQRLREAGYDELRRIVRDDEPPRPSARVAALAPADLQEASINRSVNARRLGRTLRGDLDSIVMKTLEKDPSRRYQSLSALIADIKRFLANEPVEACPPSALYRLRKFARRRKSQFALLSLLAGFLAVSMIGLAVGQVLISRERTEMLKQRDQAQAHERTAVAREETIREYLYAADVQLAYLACLKGDLQQARQKIQAHAADGSKLDRRGFEWHYLRGLLETPTRILNGHRKNVFDVVFSKDGRLLASCSGDYTLTVWNVAEGTQRFTLRDFADDVNAACFSDDGTLLATAEESNMVRIWDLRTRQEVARFVGFDRPVARVFFTADQRTLVATEVIWNISKARISTWDRVTGQRLKLLEGQQMLAVDSGAQRLAAVSDAGKLGVWKLPELELQTSWTEPHFEVLCGSFSHDGNLLATGSRNGSTRLWTLGRDSMQQLPFARPVTRAVRDLQFTADDRSLFVACGDGIARLWDVGSSTIQKVLQNPGEEYWSSDLSPDGLKLAIGCGGNDCPVQICDIADLTASRKRIYESPAELNSATLNLAGNLLAVMHADKAAVSVLDANVGTLLQTISCPLGTRFTVMAFAVAENSLWVGDSRGAVHQFNANDGRCMKSIQSHENSLTTLFIAPNGTRLASDSTDNSMVGAKVWDVETSQLQFELPRDVTEHSDGIHKLYGFASESVLLTIQGMAAMRWNLNSARELPPRLLHDRTVYGALQSPDGTMLMTIIADGVCVWDLASGRQRAVLPGKQELATAMAFSPDGRTLAVGGSSGELRLWHLPTAQPFCDLQGLTGQIVLLSFTDDNKRLLAVAKTAANGTEACAWDCVPPPQ